MAVADRCLHIMAKPHEMSIAHYYRPGSSGHSLRSARREPACGRHNQQVLGGGDTKAAECSDAHRQLLDGRAAGGAGRRELADACDIS